MSMFNIFYIIVFSFLTISLINIPQISLLCGVIVGYNIWAVRYDYRNEKDTKEFLLSLDEDSSYTGRSSK